jgi:hypothetical protein
MRLSPCQRGGKAGEQRNHGGKSEHDGRGHVPSPSQDRTSLAEEAYPPLALDQYFVGKKTGGGWEQGGDLHSRLIPRAGAAEFRA